MSNNHIITYKLKRNDEYYTPEHLVVPLLKYLKPNSTIWCPFDTKESSFVIVLESAGHKVIHSHIWEGKDFFDYEPEESYDYIISNPPFTLKFEIFEKLFEIGKPFAVIMGEQISNYGTMSQLFHKNNYQPEKITFNYRPTFDGNASSFMSVYYCKNVLPKNKHWVMETIDRKDFKKSKMYNEGEGNFGKWPSLTHPHLTSKNPKAYNRSVEKERTKKEKENE